MSEVRVINNITKEYPNMFKVTIYCEGRQFVVGSGNRSKKKKFREENEGFTPADSSLRRTKTLIKDIVLCNNFDLFVTFTLSPDKVNRFNYWECHGKISRWLHHQKIRSPDLKYLVIPEKHPTSGAWHFHGLLADYNGVLKDSGHKSKSGRPIYNLTSYRSGFTTAVKVDDQEAVANYVVKYITKDFLKMYNCRRFFCSRNLRRPTKVINSPVFSQTPPLFKHKVSEHEDAQYWIVENF